MSNSNELVVYDPRSESDPWPFEVNLSSRHDRRRSYEEVQQLLFGIRDALHAFEKANGSGTP